MLGNLELEIPGILGQALIHGGRSRRGSRRGSMDPAAAAAEMAAAVAAAAIEDDAADDAAEEQVGDFVNELKAGS